MIKVEHIRRYTVTSKVTNIKGTNLSLNKEVLVTDAELVFISSTLEWANRTNSPSMPILISRTEKMEVGDWIYDSYRKKIRKANMEQDTVVDYCFKILALPEHFSPKSLQLIVDGKLKEGKCLVECIEHKEKPYGIPYNVVALNPHITIYPDYIQSAIKICKEHDCEVSVENTDSVEEKMYTRDEVIKEGNKLADHIQQLIRNTFGCDYLYNELKVKSKEWFEQNVK
jgi:hypothetical protein